MTIRAGKKRVMVTLDGEVLAPLAELAARRHRHRGHLIEAVLRRYLSREGKSRTPPPSDPRQIDLEEAIDGLPLSSLADKRR